MIAITIQHRGFEHVAERLKAAIDDRRKSKDTRPHIFLLAREAPANHLVGFARAILGEPLHMVQTLAQLRSARNAGQSAFFQIKDSLSIDDRIQLRRLFAESKPGDAPLLIVYQADDLSWNPCSDQIIRENAITCQLALRPGRGGATIRPQPTI
ncbi:MAG TPA: hypothetical protein VF857_06295 [Spirochaetota bacterium]